MHEYCMEYHKFFVAGYARGAALIFDMTSQNFNYEKELNFGDSLITQKKYEMAINHFKAMQRVLPNNSIIKRKIKKLKKLTESESISN